MPGVEWKDKNVKDPCYPCFNALGYYISRSRVFGIQNAYENASQEVIRWYNDLADDIRNLRYENYRLGTELSEMTKAKNEAYVKYDKVKISELMRGRKTRYLCDSEVEKAERMREEKISFDKIGEALGVSGRTVRRAVKRELAYSEQ